MADMPANELAIEMLPAATPAVGRWLWQLEAARARTRRALAGLAPGLLDQMPAAANSIGSLLYHVAAIEADWLYCDVLQAPFPPPITALFPWPVRDQQGRLTMVTGQSLATHWQRLDVVREHLAAAFQPMSAADLRRRRTLSDYRATPEWVLFHLLQHEAEHRGEMQAVLARLAAT